MKDLFDMINDTTGNSEEDPSQYTEESKDSIFYYLSIACMIIGIVMLTIYFFVV